MVLAFLSVQCFYTSTEAVRTVRDGEPGKVTATLTQLMNSVGFSFVLLLPAGYSNEVSKISVMTTPTEL